MRVILPNALTPILLRGKPSHRIDMGTGVRTAEGVSKLKAGCMYLDDDFKTRL